MGFGVTHPLDVVNEGAELIHGYYGPRDQAVGQTAAGLDITHDLSSPVTAVRGWEGLPGHVTRTASSGQGGEGDEVRR
jgi:hypothetical protein